MDGTAIPWRSTRHRGVAIHVYASDERTGRTVALIRMDPGCGYPAHRHRGVEEVLVLRGGYRDELGEYRQGGFVRYDDGTEHAPRALGAPGDVACVLLAVAHEGVTLLEGRAR